jgi:hypothetical protein
MTDKEVNDNESKPRFDPASKHFLLEFVHTQLAERLHFNIARFWLNALRDLQII